MKRLLVLTLLACTMATQAANHTDCQIVRYAKTEQGISFTNEGRGAVYDNGSTVTLKNHRYPNDALRSGSMATYKDGRDFSVVGDKYFIAERAANRYLYSNTSGSISLIWDCGDKQ